MSEQPVITVSAYAHTDVGRVRDNNEDNYLILDLSGGLVRTASDQDESAEEQIHLPVGEAGFLLAVSDGMGGAQAGEVASHLAVRTVSQLMKKLQSSPSPSPWSFSERFRYAIEQANLFIHEQSLASPRLAGMGATFTGAAVHNGMLYLAQVGDSRAYIIRDGRIRQATKDQSLVGQLVEAGYITEEQAQDHAYRNVILQALGAHPDTTIVLDRLPIYQDDIVVLCSDGLSNKVQAEEIMAQVCSSPDLIQGCRQLIELANERGGEDNITVVVCRLVSDELSALTDEDEFDLVRIERDDRLPTTLEIDHDDRDALLRLSSDNGWTPSRALPNPLVEFVPPQSGAAPPADDPSPPAPAFRVAESSLLEQNISRILIVVLAVIFLGAILASIWYLKLRGSAQTPSERVLPQSVSAPMIPSIVAA
jgi:protein phosphatase